MISIKDFSFKYDGAEDFALRDISLDIDDGDFVGIIGKSGAGKTTLTHALSGIVPHYHRGDFFGEVNVFGTDTVESNPETLALTVGSVLQDTESQMVATTVFDELLFGLENFSVPKEEILSRIEETLSSVGISELRDRNIATLSGGQRQKVAIAAIIALRPKVIVLDEATGELDPQSSTQVFEILRELNEEHGVTVIAVEQKIMQLCEFSKKLIVMDSGRIALSGEVKDVLSHSEKLHSLGVNVPRVTSLFDELRQRGIDTKDIPVSVAEAKAAAERIMK